MESKKIKRKALGRGLSSLISSEPVSVTPPKPTKPQIQRIDGNLATEIQIESSPKSSMSNDVLSFNDNNIRYLKISEITPNQKQPRQDFDQRELGELSSSISTHGVIQPVLVRPTDKKTGTAYEIVAGERRWRAAKQAGLQTIPVIIRELEDRETLEISIIENVQRSNLNPIEEALAYEKLNKTFGLNQKEIAQKMGKDRVSVSNYMRLLTLPKEVQGYLVKGEISIGHAKAILTVREPAAQIGLAKKVIKENLSVRSVENIVSRVVILDAAKEKRIKKSNSANSREMSAFPDVVDRLRNQLGTKVMIRHHPSERGKIEIEYFSEAELGRIVDFICQSL